MTYINWNTIELRGNPFTALPPIDPASARWADMERLKGDFHTVLREAKGTAPTQAVLCRGPIGGGKTHAALYFGLKERWPEQEPSVRDIHIWRVPTPKETGKPDRDFYIDVMEHLDIENTRETLRSAVDEVGYETARDVLRRTMVSADLTKALLDLRNEDYNPLLNAYFLGKCTSTELRKLGLNRNIEKTQDYFRVLAGVFQCYIGFSRSSEPTQHSRVCLWIDEMEDFLYFTPSQYRPFGQGLRELVDRVSSFFTLFLNFTLTSPEEYEEIELILGAYLMDRVTHNIFFNEMRDEEMLTYVRERLAHCETEQRNSRKDIEESPYYPFKETALKSLLADLPRMTPRSINKRCRIALVKAFERGVFESDGEGWINRDFVLDLGREELDREIG